MGGLGPAGDARDLNQYDKAAEYYDLYIANLEQGPAGAPRASEEVGRTGNVGGGEG